jgi:site-specific recombinase XerD
MPKNKKSKKQSFFSLNMSFLKFKKFIKLMKNEHRPYRIKRNRFSWALDEKKFLSLQKVEKLRSYCKKAKSSALKSGRTVPVRNWFMLELGLFTGLRVEEMVNLKSTDLFLTGSQPSLSVKNGKGNKARTVYFSEAFKKECLFYLEWKEKRIPGVYLFANQKGEQLSKRTLQKSFKRCLQMAELENYYSIHCLRHTYGTYLYKASNHNLRLVQEQLGHSSIRTTQIYANLIDEEVKKSLDNLYKKDEIIYQR